MNLAYTITSGVIKYGDESCEIPFALVFYDNGIFKIETFIKTDDFFDRVVRLNYIDLIGKTEKGYDIVCTLLSCTRYQYENHKLEFISRGSVRLSTDKKLKDLVTSSSQKKDRIWFVEIEGLKMKFSDHTQIERYRNDGKIKGFDNFEFDHTSCAPVINIPGFYGNHFHFVFCKNPLNDNIILDLTKNEGYGILFYEDYLQIRTDLISFLSFLNGSQVFVRRELTGKYYSINSGKYDSQMVYIYSRKVKSGLRFDDYLPINEHHSYTGPVFSDLFLFCFDKYIQLNKVLDFNSLVFSLNNSIQTAGLEEAYFILIAALERIANNYSKMNPPVKSTLFKKTKFETDIKKRLFEVIESFNEDYISENPIALEVMKSRIGNLNKVIEGDTVQKLKEFLIYAKIPLNKNVKSLIKKERNRAVHEGKIGNEQQEKIDNYWKLDHILRDVILNLIGYKHHRRRKYHYATPDEFDAV